MTDPAPPPTYPAWPPPAPYPPAPRPRRRWVATAAAAAISAAVAATLASIITANNTARDSDATATASTVTVTAQPATPNSPAPIPTVTADRTTCQAYSRAGELLRTATTVLQIIPADKTVLDPAVRSDPGMFAATQKAASLYGQAADAVAMGTAPGTSDVLAQSARAMSEALSAMATAYRTYDPSVGDIYEVGKASDGAMATLCSRLAPR